MNKYKSKPFLRMVHENMQIFLGFVTGLKISGNCRQLLESFLPVIVLFATLHDKEFQFSNRDKNTDSFYPDVNAWLFPIKISWIYGVFKKESSDFVVQYFSIELTNSNKIYFRDTCMTSIFIFSIYKCSMWPPLEARHTSRR